MKLVNRVLAVAAILVLSACSGANSNRTVDALNKAQAVGSPFTKNLSAEYRTYANSLQKKSMDYADALHFARKGLAAASGVIVMPEVLDDWDLGNKNIIEMTQARADLVDALENGGRDGLADKAAVAQSRFDCWAEQQEKNWNATIPCKAQFYDALKDLQAFKPAAVAALPASEEFPSPVMGGDKGEVTPVQQAMFIVFFDWNKAILSGGANDVLDAVAQELKTRQDVKQVVLVGHTDTSGGAKYNKKLSLKRANAVRTALISRGVPKSKLRVEGRGEEDLLVKTADNAREPANRRAQITLE
jgi:OOP family OmpA-OmpF porin